MWMLPQLHNGSLQTQGGFGKRLELQGRRRWRRGAPQVLSETGPGGAGVGEVSGDDPIALGAADHVANLPVELEQLGADQAEVLPGADQSNSARLAQSLVTEVDVEQSLDLALRAAAEQSVGPLDPEKHSFLVGKGCEKVDDFVKHALL